jgi:hypothetical protein
MLAWLKQPKAPAGKNTYAPAKGRDVMLLAYERGGKVMHGAEGLIQLVVGPDEFASRYSHWVSSVQVLR